MFNKTLLAAFAVSNLTEATKYEDAHGDSYIQMTASQKLDLLWTNIEKDSSSGSWAHLPFVLTENMKDTFETPGDDMPCGLLGCRTKDIHSIGTVSKVKW